MDRETTEEIKRHLDVAAESLRTEIIRSVDAKIDLVRTDIRAVDGRLSIQIRAIDEKVDRQTEEVKRHFEVVTEGLRSDIRFVAEGVAGLDETFTQEFVNVRGEMREGFDGVKALLRAGYSDLDRRVTRLEQR